MKNNLLHKILITGFVFTTLFAQSQPDHLAYAVTDSVRDGMKWNFLRTLDMRTGAYSNSLFRLLNNNELLSTIPAIIPTNGVAAIAYDKKNKRLYYTPMLTDKLYYLDLRTMNKFIVTNHFTGLMPKASDQSNIITRMVIGDDDKGYALTNDGRHLIRFRTSNNPAITDLGSLVDAYGNNEISVHNGCSSFGGDIIADDDDKFFLITLARNIFKINIDTKVAKYIGTVTGLPATFTVSGAAVDKDGEKIIIVSNTDASDVYTLNIKTLVASRLNANSPFLSSDLASNYILKKKEHSHHENDDRIIISDNENNENIQLYPNPVLAKEFKINFTNAGADTYTIRVVDINGKSITSKVVTTGGKGNIVSVNLPEQISSGIYIVRVTDAGNKAWYSGKIFVQ
jgi:Secretion system C-terminal sorting domain